MRLIILMVLFSAIYYNALNAQQKLPQRNKATIDSAIVTPEHLTKDLASLLHDWQIDLSKSNITCNKGSNTVYDDSTYTQRLYDYPSEMELCWSLYCMLYSTCSSQI